MIHPYALVLSCLLTSSAVLGGHLPAAVLLMYMALIRGSKAPTPPFVLILIVLFALLQLVATLVVNIVVSFTPNTSILVFNKYRILTESFGIYQLGFGNKGWIFAGSCIPSGLLIVFIFFFRKKLTRRMSMRTMHPGLITLSWIFMNIITALLAPTVLAGLFLVIGMIAFLCIVFEAERILFLTTPRRRRHYSLTILILLVCSVCGIFASCIILVITCISQNAAVVYILGNIDYSIYGLAKIYNQPVDIAIRCFIQVFMMMITVFLAQMALDCHETNLQLNSSEDITEVQGLVRNNHTDIFTTCTSIPFLPKDDVVASASAPQTEPYQRRTLSLCSSSSNGGGGNFVNCCEYLVFVFGHIGTWLMQVLLASSRIIPLAMMAINMVAFPSVVSLSLLPTMMIGQLLRRQSFSRLLRPTLLLFFPLVIIQYMVFATNVIQPVIMRRLFFSDEGQWFGLTQLVCSEVLFLVMSAADVVSSHQAFLYHQINDHRQDNNNDNADVRVSLRLQGVIVNMSRDKNDNNIVNNTSLNSLELRRAAEHVLGPQRVAELLAYISCDSVYGFETHENIFFSLLGRRPTAEENQYLCKGAIGDVILLEKMQDSQKSLPYIYVYWLGILFRRYAILVSLLLLFIVGTFTYHMDILHAIVLVFFILHFFFPSNVNGKWGFMLAYLMFLTSFELLFTFASKFFVLPIYIADSPLQYATIGLIPLNYRYETIPYVVAVFVVAFLFQRVSVCRSWGTVVSHHEWNRFCSSTTARQLSMRITMTVATGVFVAFSIFLERSLIVDGFLALFLFLSIATAYFGMSNPLLGVLWYIACAYSSIVVVIASACQFTQLASVLVTYLFVHLCGKKKDYSAVFNNFSNKNECWREIGLYPTSGDMLLTFFLAPWYLAFMTTMTHIAAKHVRVMESERGEHYTERRGNTECQDEEPREERESTQQQEEQEGNDDELSYALLGSASLPSLKSEDQRFLRHTVKFIAAVNTVGEWFFTFGADYGGILVSVALFVAATYRFDLMNAAYIVFFLFDFTHISVLVYCVLHIFAVYTYQFSFVPGINYNVFGVPLGTLIGLMKCDDNSHCMFVVGPMLVFFVMLLRIHTHGANEIIRSRQRAEGPESSSWKSVLCTQIFFYAGYEALVLTLLVVLSLSGDSCSGAAVGIALLLLLLVGRPCFYRVFYSFTLLCLLALSLVWQYLLRLNAAQGIFSINEAFLNAAIWRSWVFKIHNGVFIGCFIGIMLLHINCRQSKDTLASFSRLSLQFNGHITLMSFVRATSVKSLRRLPREQFDRAMPRFVESSPPSCLGRVTTFIIVVVSFLNPVAIFSFTAGVASHPSIINLILLIGGLMQVSQLDMLRWRFFSIWPPIAAAYSFLIALPLIANAPYVQQVLTSHPSVSEAIGVMYNGQIIQLSPLHVTLLFFVALQTRVYSDFRFTKVIRRLYRCMYTRHLRHEEMQGWLRVKNFAEQELAEARRRALQEKLKEIQSTLHMVNDDWEPESTSPEIPAKIEVNRQQSEKNNTLMTTSQRDVVDGTAGSQGGNEQCLNTTVFSEMSVKNLESPSSGDCDKRVRSFKVRIKCAIHRTLTKAANWLAAHTYEPHRYTDIRYKSVYTRFFWVAVQLLEQHTVMLILLVTMINFMLTCCVWELLPFCFILVVANAYTPFPPRFAFVVLSFYVAFGILIKALIYIVLTQVSYSPRLLNALSWTILHVSEGAYWRQKIGYSYVLMDFIVYATLVAHQNICLSNGVYSLKDILLSREGDKPTGGTGVAGNAALSSSPCLANDEVSDEEVTGDGAQLVPPTPFSPTQRVAVGKHKLYSFLSEFVRSAISTPGVGRDWYIYYFTVDAIALLTFVLGYNKMSSEGSSTLQESVKRNLLPGPMVIVVFVSILVLIIDRMLYVTRNMKGKFLLNTISGVAYCICYLLWGNLVTVRSHTMGNVFFTLKIIALTIAVWQVRVGYPRHRRHDPFTCTEGRSFIMSCLYQLYCVVPFLWEIRVVTDWTVERTSLHFDNYLKIEDLYSIVFNRQCQIHEARMKQPVLGMIIRRSVKLGNGFLRLAILVVVLIGPLLYYSTFNPSMQNNEVTQLRLELSFTTSKSFYRSVAFTSETLPVDWDLWLARTRPSLTQQEIMNKEKSLQLMNLSSCSSEVWPISPQALRQLMQQLKDVVENKTTMELFQSLELARPDALGSFTHTVRWNVSTSTARDILYMLNNDLSNETSYVLLRDFYSPFVFTHKDEVDVYSNTDGRNVMDCSIKLRQDMDPVLNNTVRYWCIKCQSLFTSGNMPNSNETAFPEWSCLSTGEGCTKYDFEKKNGDINYNPVPMYFVVLSDPSISSVFLGGFGIIALYTTFVLAVGRLFRGMFADKAKHTILCDMADPTPVAQLIEYISLARECGDMRLEQAVYFELVDLLRSPERLLRLTGFSRRLYDTGTDMLQLSPAFPSTHGNNFSFWRHDVPQAASADEVDVSNNNTNNSGKNDNAADHAKRE